MSFMISDNQLCIFCPPRAFGHSINSQSPFLSMCPQEYLLIYWDHIYDRHQQFSLDQGHKHKVGAHMRHLQSVFKYLYLAAILSIRSHDYLFIWPQTVPIFLIALSDLFSQTLLLGPFSCNLALLCCSPLSRTSTMSLHQFFHILQMACCPQIHLQSSGCQSIQYILACLLTSDHFAHSLTQGGEFVGAVHAWGKIMVWCMCEAKYVLWCGCNMVVV